MKLIQTLVVVSLFAVFATPAEAKKRGNNSQKAAEQAQKEKARKEKDRAESRKVREKISAFMQPRDKNKDGSLTKEEFLSGETDKAAGEKKFSQFNKNNDRALYKSEIQTLLGL
jgi:Flp pilus assembly protein TadD